MSGKGPDVAWKALPAVYTGPGGYFRGAGIATRSGLFRLSRWIASHQRTALKLNAVSRKPLKSHSQDFDPSLDNMLISSYSWRMEKELDIQSRSLVNSSCFGLNIHRAGRAVARKFDNAFRSIGVNHWQFSLLVTLNIPGGLSVNELARSLVVDRTTITANVKPLERMGLLTVRVDEEDARARRIELTAKGVGVLRAAYPIWQVVNAEIGGVLETGTRDEVLGALSAITTASV